MLSKHYQSLELLCQREEKASVRIELFYWSFIPSVEEERARTRPVHTYIMNVGVFMTEPNPLFPL